MFFICQKSLFIKSTQIYKPGDKLASVREMAETFKVNPNTIQRVYQELEREGVTFTQRGMGTFITEDRDMIAEMKRDMAKDLITGFIDGMKKLGYDEDEIKVIINDYVARGKEEWSNRKDFFFKSMVGKLHSYN